MNIHEHMSEKMELACIYAEDGAFRTAARILESLAKEILEHADFYDQALGIEPPARLAAPAADEDEDEGYPPPCSDPGGHVWPDFDELDRCLCIHCGADGDA